MSIQLRGRIEMNRPGFVKIDWPVLKLFGKTEQPASEKKISEKQMGAGFQNAADVGQYASDTYADESRESFADAIEDEAEEELQQQHEDEFINLCINRSI